MLLRDFAPAALSLSLVLLATGCGLFFHADRRDMLVIVPAEDALSVATGERYAREHRIPEQRILRLPLPAGSDPAPTEIDWPTFQRQIAEPIEAYLAREDPEDEIEILVTTRGLPLRIGRCEAQRGNPYADTREQSRPGVPRGCRAAAVDAALASLGRIDPEKPALRRAVNPFFREKRSFSEFRRAQPEAPLRFLVARLIDPGTVVTTADTADTTDPTDPTDPTDTATTTAPAPSAPPTVEANPPTPPLWRIATRPGAAQRSPATRALLSPIPRQLPRHGYRVCDDCDLKELGASGSGAVGSGSASEPVTGIVYVDLEESEPLRRVLSERSISLGAPGLVIDLTPRLRPGAQGARDTPGTFDALDGLMPPDASDTAHPAAGAPWSLPFDRAVADWVAAGARAISTHLDDPGLAGVTRPAVQIEGFLAGRSAVESHFRSVPHLGWMNVFLGDPLLQRPHRAPDRTEDLDRDHSSQLDDDRDGDGIPDAQDNCVAHPNPAQRDSDGDGYGNRCDPDVNNDGLVDTSWGQIYPMDGRGDLEAIALTIRGGHYDPDHDLDGDGRVDEMDLALAQLWLFRAPGPSGRVDADGPTN